MERALKLPRRSGLFFDSITPEDGLFIKVHSVLLKKKTKYQKVEIAELGLFGKSLILDGKIQSTVFDEFIYHEALVHPVMLSHPSPENVLVIGGGEGATIREVLRHRTVKRCDMVDLDREVVDICKKHLPEMHQGSFNDPRVNLFFEDGRKYLEQCEDNTYDIVIMDSTDPIEYGPSYLLFTVEFFKIVKKKLREKGAIVIQSNMVRPGDVLCFGSVLKTLSKVFPISYGYYTYVPAFFTEWGFTVGSKGPDIRKFGSEELDKIIRKRIKGKTKFISGDVIHKMLVIPKNIQEEIKAVSRIIRDSEPLFVI